MASKMDTDKMVKDLQVIVAAHDFKSRLSAYFNYYVPWGDAIKAVRDNKWANDLLREAVNSPRVKMPPPQTDALSSSEDTPPA